MLLTRFLALLLIVLACASLPAHAVEDDVIYMWTDENGVVNFSQTEPPRHSVVEIEKPMATRPATKSPPAAAREVIRNDEFNEETRQRNCRIGHRTRNALEAHKNIYLIHPDGLYHKITDERRTEEFAKAQAIIDQYCDESAR